MLDRVSYGWGLTFFVVLGIGLWLLGDFIARKAKLAARARAMFDGAAPIDAGEYAVPQWRPDAGSTVLAMWIARVKNHIPTIALTFVSTGVVMSLAIVYEIHPGWDDPRDWRPQHAWGWFDELSAGRDRVSLSPTESSFSNVTMVGGAWLLLGLAALIVLLARRGFKTDTSRRGVNVVWDVISFWPHAVHPFVPKPYSQHAVMHLRKRIKQHLATRPASGRDVIVSAHSQGSLIAFASLHLLSDEQRERVGLLTYGSQLRQIFPRAFPAYVNYDSVSRLHLDLRRRVDQPLSRDRSACRAGPVVEPPGGGRRARHVWPFRRRHRSGGGRRVRPRLRRQAKRRRLAPPRSGARDVGRSVRPVDAPLQAQRVLARPGLSLGAASAAGSVGRYRLGVS